MNIIGQVHIKLERFKKGKDIIKVSANIKRLENIWHTCNEKHERYLVKGKFIYRYENTPDA